MTFTYEITADWWKDGVRAHILLFNSNHRQNKQLHIALGYIWLFNQRPFIAALKLVFSSIGPYSWWIPNERVVAFSQHY